MERYICRQCGKEVEKGVPTCPWCGAAMGPVMGQIQTSSQGYKSNELNNKAEIFYANDNGSFIWILAGLMLPPVGILLYFLKRRTHPYAKSALIASLVSLTSIIAVGLITGVFGKKKSPYADWKDFSKLLGKDKNVVEREIKADGQWWTERSDNGAIRGYTLQRREAVDEIHNFTVILWFGTDDHFMGATREFTGRVQNEEDFVIQFYKKMVKFYGKPDQPSADFQYDTWEHFYEGMIESSSDGKTECSITAVWEDKHVMVDIRTHNNYITIQHHLINEADWPGWLQ